MHLIALGQRLHIFKLSVQLIIMYNSKCLFVCVMMSTSLLATCTQLYIRIVFIFFTISNLKSYIIASAPRLKHSVGLILRYQNVVSIHTDFVSICWYSINTCRIGCCGCFDFISSFMSNFECMI